MNQDKKRWRFGLSLKLNIIIITSILLVAVGLTFIAYTFYRTKVDSLYYDRAEKAADAVAEGYVSYDTAAYFWKVFSSDEFRAVRDKAIEEDNDKIIEDWMKNNYLLGNPVIYEDGEAYNGEGRIMYTIYQEYNMYADSLRSAKKVFGLKSVYMQYVEDGISYNLIDPDERLINIGTAEKPIEEFAAYKGNDYIPATIYQYKGQWLCTACYPVSLPDEDDENYVNVAQVGVDLDMNDVFAERNWFLFNSILLIGLLIAITIIVSVLVTRKLVTRPLKMLSSGATKFEAGEEGFSIDEIINLPIRSNDEIGDLYREIRLMQSRIIDSTERLTRIRTERERVRTELKMASDIQTSMLPNIFPPFPDRKEFELYASMDPAKEVGGDFYDFFFIDDNHLCILIADVSDKGVPAALFMMSSKILINYRANMGGTPAEIISAVNAQLCKGNKSKMFVTVWMGILDVTTGCMQCVNAGHELPIIMTKDGDCRVYKDVHGAMVGVSDKVKYTDYEITLAPGDAIFLYTDGVPEANNASEQMYGMERLVKALSGVEDKSPEGVIRGVRDSVNEFVGNEVQFDDLTMLCLEYKGK